MLDEVCYTDDEAGRGLVATSSPRWTRPTARVTRPSEASKDRPFSILSTLNEADEAERGPGTL